MSARVSEGTYWGGRVVGVPGVAGTYYHRWDKATYWPWLALSGLAGYPWQGVLARLRLSSHRILPESSRLPNARV